VASPFGEQGRDCGLSRPDSAAESDDQHGDSVAHVQVRGKQGTDSLRQPCGSAKPVRLRRCPATVCPGPCQGVRASQVDRPQGSTAALEEERSSDRASCLRPGFDRQENPWESDPPVSRPCPSF
jgi:hypothetical protein